MRPAGFVRRVGVLARRIESLVRRHGDATAWQAELDRLAALEGHDERAAHALFLTLKARLIQQRRDDLREALARFSFVAELPPRDLPGESLERLDRDNVRLAHALDHARAVDADLASSDAARQEAAAIRQLPAPWRPAPVSWQDLRALAAEAATWRRRLGREARVARLAVGLARDAARLSELAVDLPETRDLPAEAALEVLADARERVAAALQLEAAWHAARRDVRHSDVRAHRRSAGRALEARLDEALVARDGGALAGLAEDVARLRRAAAAQAEAAARDRRRGVKPPRGGDDLGGMYG